MRGLRDINKKILVHWCYPETLTNRSEHLGTTEVSTHRFWIFII